MKVSVAALTILLIAAFCSLAFSGPITMDPHKVCCFSYIVKKIPRNLVTGYYMIDSACSQPAIVFLTKKGREICVNPNDSWVQKYVNDLEMN